jgi:dihydropteroate synthase
MFTLNCKGRLLVVDKPIVMGIINITPDSFYAESRQNTIDEVLQKATEMLQEGATILDIGGQSTRPGSRLLTPEEELERVLPAITSIRKKWPDAFISIDSFYSKVAVAALEAGADMVNDVSGGNMDANMIPAVSKTGAPYICMHMKGEPQTMQHNPVYDDVVKEVLDFFIVKTETCKKAGIKDIIIDPGFGFGKSIAHSFSLLKNLSVFKMLQKPILAGISRKSTIYKTLGVTAKEALNGTTALHMLALQNGASILRVHDVKEAMEVIKLFLEYNKY